MDIANLKTPDGDTILHEAVRNGDAGLAIWLAANYRTLNYTMGTASGRMPVHLAVSLADGFAASSAGNTIWSELESGLKMYQLMIKHAGEYRLDYTWNADARVWTLADRSGKTVRDYTNALCKDNNEQAKAAFGWASQQLLSMCFTGRAHADRLCPQGHLLKEQPPCTEVFCAGCCIDPDSTPEGSCFYSCSACHFDICHGCYAHRGSPSSEHSLDSIKSLCGRFPKLLEMRDRKRARFLYAAVSHGRLDVLKWYEAACHPVTSIDDDAGDGDRHGDDGGSVHGFVNQGLAHSLGDGQRQQGLHGTMYMGDEKEYLLPRVHCCAMGKQSNL